MVQYPFPYAQPQQFPVHQAQPVLPHVQQDDEDLKDITATMCLVSNSTQTPSFSLKIIASNLDLPFQIKVPIKLCEFAAEPGCDKDYKYFRTEQVKYMDSLSSLFEDDSSLHEPDGEEDENSNQNQDRYDNEDAHEFMDGLQGFDQATSGGKKFTATKLLPSPKTREHWLRTRGLDRAREKWGGVKANKTVQFFTNNPYAFMFRPPQMPADVTLLQSDIPWENFLKIIQEECGAAAHAVLSGTELTLRLKQQFTAIWKDLKKLNHQRINPNHKR